MTTSVNPQLGRAYTSLVGLSVGDAFGQQFFPLFRHHDLPVERQILSPAPWYWTDDTNMALSIVAELDRNGEIDSESLAQDFIARYDPQRGYGPSLNGVLRVVKAGSALMDASAGLFNGQGSYGNGAAMRIAPLGAYFAANLAMVVGQTEAATLPTHTHPEARAGAIAVAVAAAYATRLHGQPVPTWNEFLELVLPLVPASEVASGLRRALSLAEGISVHHAGAILGTGSAVSAQDTVPFALWCAAHYLTDFETALWTTAQGLGDIDTTCAIVGGIVACYTGLEAIPQVWLQNREPLPEWVEAL